jgi:hypothetical protein
MKNLEIGCIQDIIQCHHQGQNKNSGREKLSCMNISVYFVTLVCKAVLVKDF